MSALSSSIGRKYLMAGAGLVWTLFVFGHMAGNMLILLGAEAYNKYGHAIITNKPLLYGTEAALIGAILVHVIVGFWLTYENRKAKPQKYAVAASSAKAAPRSSKTMIFHGSIILVFIILHINTFKYGTEYYATYGGVEMRDLHRLIVEVFQNPMYVLGYIVCLGLLGVHLSHGFGSVFQSFGFNHPKYTKTIKKVSWIYAIVVAGGFIVQPIYVYLIYRG